MGGEEWKAGGFCPECRRRNICKADCKPGREYKITRVQRMIFWDMLVLGRDPRPDDYRRELRDEAAVLALIRWAQKNFTGNNDMRKRLRIQEGHDAGHSE